jgi:hypothetical protein
MISKIRRRDSKVPKGCTHTWDYAIPAPNLPMWSIATSNVISRISFSLSSFPSVSLPQKTTDAQFAFVLSNFHLKMHVHALFGKNYL